MLMVLKVSPMGKPSMGKKLRKLNRSMNPHMTSCSCIGVAVRKERRMDKGTMIFSRPALVFNDPTLFFNELRG